ncbi:MAG: hydroxymethylbilane synthase [Gammaproteobacteria bacterium]|nr:hydroxymethylbilane synthase [Gammaproteobacteria bacterium]
MTAAPLRIATRKSPLALWQAEHVAARLRAAHPDVPVVLLPMSTKGDQILDRSLAAIGGKGLFIKELEIALDERRADLAVHSMKDVPADLPAPFTIGAVLERADPRDALVAPRARALEDLPSGARVGTSSLRRRAQLLGLRPDLRIEALRGNLNTRIQRLDEGSLDAIVLACAGLARLGWEPRIAARLPFETSLPAVGQGAIGVECRAGDAPILERIAALEHPPTRVAVDAERAFSRRLGGSCQSPVAAHATLDAERLVLRGLVASPDGRRVLRDTLVGTADAAATLGEALAQRMLAAGAREILDTLAEP